MNLSGFLQIFLGILGGVEAKTTNGGWFLGLRRKKRKGLESLFLKSCLVVLGSKKKFWSKWKSKAASNFKRHQNLFRCTTSQKGLRLALLRLSFFYLAFKLAWGQPVIRRPSKNTLNPKDFELGLLWHACFAIHAVSAFKSLSKVYILSQQTLANPQLVN